MAVNDRCVAERMKILANLVPEIKCKDGCCECCDVQYLISDYITGGFPIWKRLENMKCVCSRQKDGMCEIFEVRPLICRLFFKSEDGLDCPRGLEPEGGRISKEEMRRIIWCSEKGTIQDAKAISAEYLRKDIEK